MRPIMDPWLEVRKLHATDHMALKYGVLPVGLVIGRPQFHQPRMARYHAVFHDVHVTIQRASRKAVIVTSSDIAIGRHSTGPPRSGPHDIQEYRISTYG